MFIREPEISIITPIYHIEEMLQRIEEIGRVCYKSESHITEDSAKLFIKQRIAEGHLSIIEHESISIRVICDRGVSHEIVRHRLASYSQESTRYVNYQKRGIEFIRPSFELTKEDLKLLETISDYYNKCIKEGRKPQEARYFLPNGLKTEIVITMNLREWRHFLKLRTSVKAHPQMREIADMIHNALKSLIPIVFDDLEIE